MVLTESDKAVIKACFIEKRWTVSKILKEFPGKKWKKTTVFDLIKKIQETGSTKRKFGSGRRKSVSVQNNVNYVQEFSVSQEDKPGSHLSQRKIKENLGISRSSVQRIQKSLKLKAFKRMRVSRRDGNVRQKRKKRCRNLLDKFSTTEVKNIIFTDEKDFTIEIAKNRQNDVVYGKQCKRDVSPSRLYHQTCRFSKKIMVLAGVSWNGKTNIHFVDEKTKMNSKTYVDLLENKLLPDCKELFPENNFTFQQLMEPRLIQVILLKIICK